MAYNFGIHSENGFSMQKRLLQLPRDYSFFLFGARGVGKSTWIRHSFSEDDVFWIDLLNFEAEDRYSKNPALLLQEVRALPHTTHTIVIDEIQKVPKLLDAVHSLIESTDKRFVLTGSSARKLKQGGANLLAGRAFVKHLYPFTYIELKEKFNLDKALAIGMLPKVWEFQTQESQWAFLEAYTYTYLKEEIWAEHLVKNLDPFRLFLEVSAQSSGKIINYANIAKDCGVDDKTVKTYFNILEDTWVGFTLKPYQHSFRKRLSQKPKFYFFDVGVARALARTHRVALTPKTFAYGDYFEQFVITECYKLCHYFHPDYQLSYLRTKDDLEIDLIIERPQQPLLFIEIKSTTQIDESALTTFKKIYTNFPDAEFWCLSNDPIKKVFFENRIIALYWQDALKTLL